MADGVVKISNGILDWTTFYFPSSNISGFTKTNKKQNKKLYK